LRQFVKNCIKSNKEKNNTNGTGKSKSSALNNGNNKFGNSMFHSSPNFYQNQNSTGNNSPSMVGSMGSSIGYSMGSSPSNYNSGYNPILPHQKPP
jgi:hypothetical protein